MRMDAYFFYYFLLSPLAVFTASHVSAAYVLHHFPACVSTRLDETSFHAAKMNISLHHQQGMKGSVRSVFQH